MSEMYQGLGRHSNKMCAESATKNTYQLKHLGYDRKKSLLGVRSPWYDAYQVDFLSAAVWNTITSFEIFCPQLKTHKSQIYKSTE